ncbi:MAG: 30S ribosomal protein S20 [Candidatus Cloacimonetes bacterium]|nr:30S ribosomal protein S20 [Candidatus Cloacimonadota bacterium]
MANIASVAKRARQAEKRRLRNAPLRARMRSVKKQAAAVLAGGNVEEIRAFVPQALRTFDKLVSKNILRKQTASRYKSRIMAKVNAIDPEFTLPKITGAVAAPVVEEKKAPVKKAAAKKPAAKKPAAKKPAAKKAPAKKAAAKKED